MIAVFHSERRHHEGAGHRRRRSTRPRRVNPGSRVSSYFTTGSRAYVSKDGHTTFARSTRPGRPDFTLELPIKEIAREAQGGDAGRRDGQPDRPRPARCRLGGASGPSVLTEALIGGLGALVILLLRLRDAARGR